MKTTEPITDPETGYLKYPERPKELPDESEYPKKYTIKVFTQKEIQDFTHQRSIKGHSIKRMEKGEVKVLLSNGELKNEKGWIPSESGLLFRCMAIGLVKTSGWSVVERTTGISLMPNLLIEVKEKTTAQLELNFDSQPTVPEKRTAKTRDKAIKLAITHIASFSKDRWIEIQEQVTYKLAGIDFEIIITPEQEALENEYSKKFNEVNEANELKRKTKNFLVTYKNLRVYPHSKPRPKMTKNELISVPEKLNPKQKTKFFFGQEKYGNSIEVEGILLPIDIDGFTEMKDLVIVKGSEFKNTPAEMYHTASKYYVYDPYLGLAVGSKSTSLKGAVKNTLEKLMIHLTPENINKLNTNIQRHNEKILAAQSDEDITRFL